MTAPRESDLDGLEQLLRSAGLPCSAPTAHGLLTGCLVADPGATGTTLERALGEAQSLSTAAAGLLPRAVEALRLDLLRAFNDAELSFEPMLPGDDAELEVRTRALGEWVDGFLGGFGQTPRPTGQAPSPQAAELLRDFAEIARIAPEPDATEEHEQALAELAEYVRVGVMLLADEFAPAAPRTRIPMQ
ncbi:Uncharacterized protein family UPF0149 (YgfB) [Thioalkalivibrio nitratireducens DSM 14787]|uniref:Uncharacterized protein family UPF0149 (YgfB) n=1 Tax=Thioalkalivibrio nitratireducens (strain DSM 14787 / UNIQEM 213 / ALEN2) TaxID=1255043 RepID=L0DT07_THIND|nr:YecA family protein [Thioalkalivibrio nitratireducens]AGA32744.1 Uncharacterized protein family UPF0149 (YgfB) [Thioalkalivibrio nitratireducens DSM 14787]